LIVPKKTLPRIVAVTVDKRPLTLRVRWDKGDDSRVDVSGLIETFRVYEPLRRSPEVFAQVRLGEHGTDVVWSDDVDMSADTLWRLRRSRAARQCLLTPSNAGANARLTRSMRPRARLDSVAARSPIMNTAQSPFRVSLRSRLAALNMCERDSAIRATKTMFDHEAIPTKPRFSPASHSSRIGGMAG
jgi:hypothetical protein